jgi:hypothetical protein
MADASRLLAQEGQGDDVAGQLAIGIGLRIPRAPVKTRRPAGLRVRKPQG